MSEAAIVTFVIGDSYVMNWRRFCEDSWRSYAAKFGFDLIPISHLIDESPRAGSRSPAWQKCIALSHPSIAKYRRVVLLDSDVAINVQKAPNILEQVTDDFVGGVISGSFIHSDLLCLLRERLHRENLPYQRGAGQWREYQGLAYQEYGLPPRPEGIIQTGVLVVNPAKHADVFRQVYEADYPIETRCFEQVPLSSALLSAGLFQPIDGRFNCVFHETALIYYPFLSNRAATYFEVVAKLAVQTQLLNNFFLHFAYCPEMMRFLRS